MTRTNKRTRDSGGSNDNPPKIRKTRYNLRSRSKRSAKLGGDQEGRINIMSQEEYWNLMSVLKTKKDVPSDSLTLTKESFHKEENEVAHHTDEYEQDDLVVRRGQGFKFSMTFDRNVNTSADVVVIQFAFGDKPKESKGSILRLKLNLASSEASKSMVGKWSAVVTSVKGSTVEAQVYTPATAFVGKYGVFVETKLKDDAESVKRYDMKDKEVIILFNPWVKDDVVFMENEDERFEYVLNDHGRIWVGSAYNHSGKPWNFGQFDSPVLDAALHLMDRAEIGDSGRRNPVTFTRAMSSLSNSMDNNGVLEGRWTETFPKGTTVPWKWTGSVKILKEFMESDKPVQFGQCWVFSGLMTSLLRSLGIPTRSVTNFESAHDTDGSMTIDNHFNQDGSPAAHLDDSVWNFHVWNESFFRRTDLPAGYDGWQAHDATPQESSEDVMRCGPAPLKAIKEGHVYLNYDVPFIFSEVNGDKVTWHLLDDGDMIPVDIDRHAVGKNISTKSVGSNFRHDVTLEYKYPEGSEDERRVVRFANQFGTRSDEEIYTSKITKDVQFTVELPEAAEIGTDFDVSVRAANTTSHSRHVSGRLTLLSSYYTGVPGKKIDGRPFDMVLGPGEDTLFTINLTSDMYLSKINPEAVMKLYASFKVKETGQQFCTSKAFSLAKPALSFKVPEEIHAKEVSTGVVEFTNPLPVALTGASLSLESGIIVSSDVCNFAHAIQPGETVSFEFEVNPRRAGLREISGTFSSDQLNGVDGAAEIRIVSPMD